MRTVEFEISDKLSMRLQLVRDAKRFPGTVEDLIQDMASLRRLEGYTDEQFHEALQSAERHYLEKDQQRIWDLHPLQGYILHNYKNGQQKIIEWRTCKVHEAEKFSPSTTHKEHIGEYYYSIRVVDDNEGLFRVVKSQAYHYRKTLKSLKRAINKEMGYDHYKVSGSKK